MVLFLLFIEFVGGFFAWIGLKGIVTTSVRRWRWLPVEGTVTGFKKSRAHRAPHWLYRPYYRYFVEGKKYIGVSDTGSSFRRYRVRGPIRLFVNPKSPGESMVLDFGTWVFSWGIFLVGLFPMAIGVWLAVEAYAGKGN